MMMKSKANGLDSLVLTLVALSSLVSVYTLTRIDNIVHQDLYRYGLTFSAEWAMPYSTMTTLAYAIGWVNIFIALVFEYYAFLSLRKKSPMLIEGTTRTCSVAWRVSWRSIFDVLVRLDTRKLKFGIGNPYGKSMVLEVEPQERTISLSLHPYEKGLILDARKTKLAFP